MADANDNPPSIHQANASPPYRLTLSYHLIAGVLIQSVWYGVSSMMAVLARKRFGAGDWETLFITAAVSTFMVVSIYWNSLMRRMSLGRYLLVHWACTMGPIAAGALATDFWTLWICYAIAACGIAGWTPAAGEILKRLYPDHSRGRVFGVISSAAFLGMCGITYAIGQALDYDNESFRVYLPLATILYGVGIVMLQWLIHSRGANRQAAIPQTAERKAWYEPVLSLRRVLRSDRTFYRYEAAFMTYGIGWMICNALLPILATDRLKMSYTEYADSTQVVLNLSLPVFLYPMGWLLDRIGPAKVSSVSFAGLFIYPVALIFADSIGDVRWATVAYGLAMAGVQIGWMIGPVSLAPSAEHVAEYTAIHATLVGIRGIIFQFLGMLLYRLTGSFTWPLVVAALAFLWAAYQMWTLHPKLAPVIGKLHTPSSAAPAPIIPPEISNEGTGLAPITTIPTNSSSPR